MSRHYQGASSAVHLHHVAAGAADFGETDSPERPDEPLATHLWQRAHTGTSKSSTAMPRATCGTGNPR